MKYKSIVYAILVAAFPVITCAQGVTETRSFMKSMPVGRESRLELTIKYGAMHISTWDKDSAYVRVELKGYASGKEKLKKMFEGISVNFGEAKDLYSVRTDFTQSISMIFENFKGMTGKYITYDSKVEINYYVNVPVYLNLHVDSKYGDVFMEDNNGESSVSVANGSLKAGALGKGTSLNLSFCDASLNSLESGKVTSSFSELAVIDAGNISISSVSSRYEIDKGGEIRASSRRDKFFIDRTLSFSGDSYFSEIRIGSLEKELELSTKYGSLNIENIAAGFGTFSLNSGYTDVILEFARNSSYEFEIRETASSVGLPSDNLRSERKT
ncbi:MAG: hypothetical protein MUD02_00545, partial [Bacteroidales bacterium]|nr:hypothetical protein [Bacteroidales bacterium]